MINLDWRLVGHITIAVSILWLFLITVYLRKENDKLKARLKAKRWMKFNINEKVKVRITNVGEDILSARRQDENSRMRAAGGKEDNGALYSMDEEGWAARQLWTVMQEFGPHIGLGCKEPIETTIMLEIQESDDD